MATIGKTPKVVKGIEPSSVPGSCTSAVMHLAIGHCSVGRGRRSPIPTRVKASSHNNRIMQTISTPLNRYTRRKGLVRLAPNESNMKPRDVDVMHKGTQWCPWHRLCHFCYPVKFAKNVLRRHDRNAAFSEGRFQLWDCQKSDASNSR